jgi:SAM-dependent methyltransferase
MDGRSGGYHAATYGDRIADVYDSWGGLPDDTHEAVELLAGLAGQGPALELGIGTGRVALPLRERGIEVHGIDASERMVERLRAKPGGGAVPVTIGDFAEVGVGGTFSLVYVVFNTLFALSDQGAQVRCFERVASRLRPGGSFVVEAFVPDLTLYERGQRIATHSLGDDQVHLLATLLDPVEQRVRSQHVVIEEGGTRLYPVMIRYAWPSELDLMARLAGMELVERWGGWRRDRFSAESRSHVSVYRRS